MTYSWYSVEYSKNGKIHVDFAFASSESEAADIVMKKHDADMIVYVLNTGG